MSDRTRPDREAFVNTADTKTPNVRIVDVSLT